MHFAEETLFLLFALLVIQILNESHAIGIALACSLIFFLSWREFSWQRIAVPLPHQQEIDLTLRCLLQIELSGISVLSGNLLKDERLKVLSHQLVIADEVEHTLTFIRKF